MKNFLCKNDTTCCVSFLGEYIYVFRLKTNKQTSKKSVEVDCTSIFQPGQRAVAMGRVKEGHGLHVANFHIEATGTYIDWWPNTIYMYIIERSRTLYTVFLFTE
jgi:hypothetical protein